MRTENTLLPSFDASTNVYITVQARPPLPKEQLLYDESNPPPKGVLMTCLEDVTSKMSDMEIARQRAAMWASKSERVSKRYNNGNAKYNIS